jgi:hypothetical protein
MPYIREDNPPSPNAVNMPYLRRFCIITRRNGAKAYDLYETMNRQAYFRDNGRFRYDAASRNIETLMAIRAGEVNAMDSELWDVTLPQLGQYGRAPDRMNNAGWFFQHGVEVPMEVYDEQEWDLQAIDAAEQAEAAHALWNMWDLDNTLSDATETITLSSISDAEIEDLMNNPIEEWEEIVTDEE